MSYFLPHLPSGWHVDQAILAEENRVVIIRFGHDWDSECMRMDETLYGISEKVKNFAVIYLVDVTKVPDFTKMYELYDPCTVMFFYRNKHIMIDLEQETITRSIGPWMTNKKLFNTLQVLILFSFVVFLSDFFRHTTFPSCS
ncbi:hypothetical protein H4Q26_011177 [Puccinia striiformis f. sp. tritici PST-130]|nr:hypothetical protein H4Q26_011177 [Puccinia striiformis f. sp. tritici PST-130]